MDTWKVAHAHNGKLEMHFLSFVLNEVLLHDLKTRTVCKNFLKAEFNLSLSSKLQRNDDIQSYLDPHPVDMENVGITAAGTHWLPLY